jgi:hypothetical protein
MLLYVKTLNTYFIATEIQHHMQESDETKIFASRSLID